MITTILNFLLVAGIVIVVIFLVALGMLWWLQKNERY